MAKMREKNIEELFSEMSLQKFDAGSNFFAKPTYIVDPHNFYVIPFSYIFHLPKLSKPGKPIESENLKENMVVIYTSKNPDVNKYFKIELDENIRGVIQHIGKDKKCTMYALDRGFIEDNVTIDRIFEPASQEAKSIASLIQHCELALCHPIGTNFSKDCIESFIFFIGNEKLSISIRGKTALKLKVVVYNSNPDDVATLLAYTGYTYLT